MERKPWMDQEAPTNYVAGLGRGATGFTTRSDIGPARAADPAAFAIPAAKPKGDDDDDKEDYSESNYDEFEGYGGSFFDPAGPYEQDDREADAVWDAIDKHMDSRRKERREARMREELEQFRALRPKIQSQFADLKTELGSVSAEEWDSLPEIGDHTTRHKKKVKTDRFGYVPVPDSLLEKARAESEQFSSLDPKQQAYGGFDTPMADGSATPAGVTTDLREIGIARQKFLSLQMGRVSDSISGQTVVDPKGYLTDLTSMVKTTDAEIGDIKKARLLLQSVRKTNPKHAAGWIASAKLEEIAGKLSEARKLITTATQICPDSEDVWIEAARLHTPDVAKSILAKAIKSVPKSIRVWMQAAALETDIKLKKRVLRRALEFIPNSPSLWKAAIELEGPEDARIMLGRAVECIPHRVEMWLALAHLETYENARKVLNTAIKAIPTEPSIWITAAKLEDAHHHEDNVKNIIKKAIKSLGAHKVVIDREQWIKEAEDAEKAGAVATCQAIVRETIHSGVEDEDRKRTWMEDAEACVARGSIETARAIYAVALTVFPAKKSLWLRVAHLEKSHGTKEALESTLKKAVEFCPKAEILWLMYAKEKWLENDVAGARAILTNAFAANPDSEQIWLAAVKLENENNETERARSLLKHARERAGTERVFLKSAVLERDANNTGEEKALLEEALAKFPQYPKFWMMRGQLEEHAGKPDAAKEIYQRGVKNCAHSIPLWSCAVLLEEKTSASRARSLLEKARLLNPKNPDLWLLSVRVERRAGNQKVAQTMLAKALQECPNAGILWAETIDMEPLAQKKTKSVDALKRCDNDPHVRLAVAKIFWADRKPDKAKTWFDRTISLNPDLGDAWAYYYRFLLAHGTEPEQQAVVKKCIDAEPHHGEHWVKISKDPANSRLKTEQMLKKVAASVEDPE
eukprot:TRINITY_DN4880_c0_g1_i1.p1 TRINITY_DN4880_c0_g1~~TRINITY_DN4880_c0_g1_i1.p1  ORF type:complete len:920 (+),score=321.96 TRINITY_DN4880_c0_g1_i1:169-2928(+)